MAKARIAAFGCLHAPVTCPKFFNWLLREIESFNPTHIVNLGDWYEGLAASRWSRHDEQDWSVFDEHRAVGLQAKAINDIAPDAKKYWLYGNHDDNLFGTLPDRIPKDLREAVQWRNSVHVAPHLESWKVIDKYGDRVKLRLGPVTFQHGTSTTASAGKDKGYTHGTPYGLYVAAHTHRPIVVTQAQERQALLPYWHCNVGTGIDWDHAHYMTRLSMALWGRGLALIETPGVDHRRTAYASQVWDAELKIHSWCH